VNKTANVLLFVRWVNHMVNHISIRIECPQLKWG